MAAAEDTHGTGRLGAAWRRRRGQIGLAVVLLLVAFRVALPVVLRRVIVSQVNAALAGSIEVGDVDLWLLRGGIALKDVVLVRDHRAPGDPPLVRWRSFYVRVARLPLLWHTVRVKNVELDGLMIDVDRLADGSLVFPTMRTAESAPAPVAAPPEAPPPAAPGKPWNVFIDRVALRRGGVRVRDYVAKPPQRLALALPTLDVQSVSLQYGPDRKPGHGLLQGRFGGGKLRAKVSVVPRRAGFAVTAHLGARGLPLDHVYLHIPQLGWSGCSGRVDAGIGLRVEPARGPVAHGQLAVRDLDIRVPGEAEPAVAWRRFEVAVERIDLGTRHAHVSRVALDGARVLVRPREPVVLPVLPRPAPAARAVPPAAAPAASEPAGKPWSWRVDAVEVRDAGAKIFLEPPPLEIGLVQATVHGLSNEPGTHAEVALELREGDGTLGLAGSVGLEPLAATLTAKLHALALSRLVAAAGAVPVRLTSGALDGELHVVAEQEPVTVAGTLTLSDLGVAAPTGEDFSLGWKGLEVGLREARIPGLLDHKAHGAVRADFDAIRLTAPRVALTRTAEGLALPGATPSTAPAAEAAPSPPPAPAPAASAEPAAPAGPPAPAPQITVARLEVSDGEASLIDRTVKPFYRGRISALTLEASGLRFPENVFDDFSLTFKAPGDAPVSVKGQRVKERVEIETSVQAMSLPQFNPYAVAAGYGLSQGTLTYTSKLHWDKDHYETTNDIELRRFVLAGVQGDSLFMQHFGVPLSLALGLMRDVHGTIALGVPIQGSQQSGMQIDLATVVTEALTRAIINTIASPLKLIGAVVLEGDRVSAVAPEPIAFKPGRAELDDDAWRHVNDLSTLLSSFLGLRLELRGSAGPADVRALKEAAVLADLEAERPVLGALKNLATRGELGAIRGALTARAKGAQAELTPAQQERLDSLVAEKSVTDAQLNDLAAARAERLRKLLADDYGVGAERVGVGELAVDPKDGKPEVRVSLAS
jgi:hypothetical protein